MEISTDHAKRIAEAFYSGDTIALAMLIDQLLAAIQEQEEC